jgi:hypothetical protein
MIGWLLWLAGLAITAAVLTLALRREFARLDRDRRYQLWLETSPALAKLARDLGEFKRQVGEQLMPSMVKLAAAFQRFASAVNEPRPEPSHDSEETGQ